MKLFTISCKLSLFLCAFIVLCGAALAQVRPVYDQGALGLGRLLKRINTAGSVMMIGAHPDDEDSALLAYLARGENARTAYLSLTRGDGGQNILGAELFESLGIIRTEELLQARRLDGAEQYFTRAFDYGFSKTLDEARAKWPEELVLCDAVRAIRDFKPLVVTARFSGTPADGHGQHQYAGYIAPLAVRAAADQTKCPGAGNAWQVKKFYVGQGFRSTAEPGLSVNTGTYDALLGRSYFEIAMEGRSQHKSQEQGLLELRGAQYSGLNLAENPRREKSIFDGLDVAVTGIASNTNNAEPAAAGKIAALKENAARALREYNALEPRKILPLLAEGYKLAHDGIWSTRNPFTKDFLEQKKSEYAEAVRIAGGIELDALADKEVAVAGGQFTINVKVFFPAGHGHKLKSVKLRRPDGWPEPSVEAAPKPAATQGFFRRETGNEERFFNAQVPKDAEPTQPYWMQSERKDALYDWESADRAALTLPFQAPLLTAEITMEMEGVEVTFAQPAAFRYADPVRGEVRRELNVAPKVSLAFDAKMSIVSSTAKTRNRECVVTVTNATADAVAGTVSLDLPANWTAAPASPGFELKNKGEKTNIKFVVTMPRGAAPGNYKIGARAAIGAETFAGEMKTLAYPHIQTHRFYAPARMTMNVLDLRTAPVRVGYISGSGDEVPAAIKQMGFDLTMLDEKELSGGNLARFGTIVIGIRASETRPDLVANNQRVLDFVKQGGTLIVQYQRPEFARLNMLPFPAQLGPRVVDENAKVTILDPAHPAFNVPNKITDADFAGWVQERNLYNFTAFDAAYKPLLEAHDANEKEDNGGLVVADLGKGKYVYCSYALFRQLPAGVPGAYRLFANLLSLGAN